MRLAPLLLGMMLAACAQPASVSGDAANAAPKIVSLNPCTDAILAEVTEAGQLLAISHYSHDPAASSMDLKLARQFAVTGGTVEEIISLQPDIVVAGSFLAPSTRTALDDLGIRVETFGMAADVEQSINQVRTLAGIAGQTSRGDQLVARIEAALAAGQGDADGQIPAVLWQPSGIVPGEGTLIADLMRRAGFSSHSQALGMGQADYLSLEQLLVSPPRVLLIAGQERSQAHPALDRLSEVHRASLAASMLYCGGPTIIAASRRLKAIRDEVS
ncbi:ABC transporter substrate-binding protein [Pontixanthobacter luteolus]|uniref:ABC transporter substrate-binding protein n=1 Tax=Pontixanthobacter luteolus TaxID=295089 RepID=UPI002302A86A|nr:ABC transporter substrate-binding protein [Pontixanthobacter luteolus]